MYQLEFNNALDKTLSDAKVKDNGLLKTLLNMDNIKLQEGKIEGLESQIEAIKGTHSYLFEEERTTSTGSIGNFGRGYGSSPQFTADDVRKMTPAQINENWEHIKNIKL